MILGLRHHLSPELVAQLLSHDLRNIHDALRTGRRGSGGRSRGGFFGLVVSSALGILRRLTRNAGTRFPVPGLMRACASSSVRSPFFTIKFRRLTVELNEVGFARDTTGFAALGASDFSILGKRPQ